jgi:hypothetical protein
MNQAIIPTVTDSGPNSYTAVSTNSDITFADGLTLSATIGTHALTTSSTITESTGATSVQWAITAAGFTGIASNAVSTAYGKALLTNGSGTTPSVTTSASVNAGDLVVCLVYSGVGTGLTQPANWTALSVTTSSAGVVGGGYQVMASAGTVTYQPTVTSGNTTDMIIAAFSAAAGGPPPPQQMFTMSSLNGYVFGPPGVV